MHRILDNLCSVADIKGSGGHGRGCKIVDLRFGMLSVSS